MTFPTSAKITCPQSARTLARTRLYERLDRLRAYPVVWVAGPPGVGKTTLVSSYLDTQNIKGIWYQVDVGDSDPATLFHYMNLAALQAAPRYRTPLPAFTPEHQPGLLVFARRYFEELFSRLKAPAAVVLDNYQEIAADSAFQAVVAEAAEVLPKGVCLLIISRTEPPPAFARLRANSMLEILNSTELKFTLDEASSVAKLRGKCNLEPAVVELLHQRASGCTVGFILMSEIPDFAMEESAIPVSSNYQVLFDYYASEIFNKFDATTQSVLCQAALLPKASTDIVCELTGNPEAGNILADLYRANYFVQKQGHVDSYQFHPLFHEFLLHSVQKTFPPAQLSALRAQAAVLLDVAGDIEAAADLWQQASDWGALEVHALKHAPMFAVQARFQILETWLRALPAQSLERTPWLSYWLGVCRMQFNPMEAKSHFKQAYDGFSCTDEAAGLYAAWSGVVESIFFMWRDFTSLGPWLEALEELRRRHPQWPSPEIERRVVSAAAAGYAGHRPDHPDAQLWLAYAQRLIDAMTDDMQRIQLVSQMLLAFYWLGDHRRTALLVKSLDHASNDLQSMPVTQAWWSGMVVLSYWKRLMPRAALKRFEEALASTNASGVHSVDYLLHMLAVYAALIAGDLPLAEKYLQTVKKLMPQDSVNANLYFWSLSAFINLQAGKFPTAADESRQALALAQAAAIPFGMADCHLSLAVALFETGERAAAQEQIDAARAIGISTRSRQVEYWCCALEAYMAFSGNDAATGREMLARAMLLSREMDGAPLYWWPQTRVAWFYAKALEHGIETDHVRDLIRRLELVPADPANAPDSWPFPLKMYTLGRFSVVVDEKPLKFTGKAQKKPLELLMGLIALGGRDVRLEKLAQHLWPESEGDAAASAFETTLHRLRKLLGNSDVIQLSNGKLSLDARFCWVDVWAFERLLGKVEALLTQGAQDSFSEIDAFSTQLHQLYQGKLLANESDAIWLMPARERLHAKFLRVIALRGRRLEEAGQWRQAIACYQKALEIAPESEAFYQSLMSSHHRLGERADAIDVYQRCCNTFVMQLSIQPSAETEALYQAIIDS